MQYAVDKITGRILGADAKAAENVDMLGVWKAFNSLHKALHRCGIGAGDGPAPVVLAMSGEDFLRLRDAMRAADPFSAAFFGPKTCGGVKRPVGRAMIAGIDIVASND